MIKVDRDPPPFHGHEGGGIDVEWELKGLQLTLNFGFGFNSEP